MDLKRESMDELREYALKKVAVQSLVEELAQAKEDLKSLGGSSMSSTPVKGGGSAWEDKRINLIVRREKTATALRRTRAWIARVDRGLAALSKEDRLILERFFIYPAKGNPDRLCDELNIERSAVYRRRDAALWRYTLARYGCVEV